MNDNRLTRIGENNEKGRGYGKKEVRGEARIRIVNRRSNRERRGAVKEKGLTVQIWGVRDSITTTTGGGGKVIYGSGPVKIGL